MQPAPGGFRIEVLLAHREWMARTARALVHGDAEAGDLEQDAWLGILERPPADVPRSPRAWLGGLLRFKRADRARAAWIRRRHETGAARPEGTTSGPGEVVSRAEIAERVARTVLGLEEPFRTTILLRYFEALDTGAIGVRMGVPPETVRTRLHRAIGRLRERLDEGSGGDRSAWCIALMPLVRMPAPLATSSGSAAGTGAVAGGLLVAPKTLGLAAAVLVLGGGAGWWAGSRRAPDPAGSAALSAEVAALRATTEDQARRIALLETPAPPGEELGRLRSAVEGQAEKLSLLERSVAPLEGQAERFARLEASLAAVSAGPAVPGSAARRRKVLEDLKSITESQREIAIDAALRELVLMGDAAVPDVAALLESGAEVRYHEKDYGMAMSAGSIRYSSLRMILIDALRQIGSPTAKKALFESVRKSERLTDYRDLLVPYQASNDRAVTAGVSALVPDMLRKLAEVGVTGDDLAIQQFARTLGNWIRRFGMGETAELVERVLRKESSAPGGATYAYQVLFGVLVEFAPERAADVAFDLEERHPDRNELQALSGNLSNAAPLAAVARYFEALFARGLETEQRVAMYYGMPYIPFGGIQDPAKRAEDAKVLLAFLEERLGIETDAKAKAAIESRIPMLRQAIDQLRR